MANMHQEVKIKKDIDVPRLKGRLKPIMRAPIHFIIKPFVKDTMPLYIDPLPIKPIIPVPQEPKLKVYVEPVIPEYIGDSDEQPENVREEHDKVPAADQSRETYADDEIAPRSL